MDTKPAKPPIIRLLGICASSRKGNSHFLLKGAIAEAKKVFGDTLDYEIYHIKKKFFAPCDACGVHKKLKGECRVKDDFQELRDKWVRSDAIIYSLPVYHMSVPGQLKCFIDRLGNSQGFYYNTESPEQAKYDIPRLLKAIGVIVQGAHLYGGQEKALQFMIDHILLMRCVPVSGDLSESYIGALGWTGGTVELKAIESLLAENDRDAALTFRAAKTLGVRVVQMANILRQGLKQCKGILDAPMYFPKHQMSEEGN